MLKDMIDKFKLAPEQECKSNNFSVANIAPTNRVGVNIKIVIQTFDPIKSLLKRFSSQVHKNCRMRDNNKKVDLA
jgi:hypothetical protein